MRFGIPRRLGGLMARFASWWVTRIGTNRRFIVQKNEDLRCSNELFSARRRSLLAAPDSPCAAIHDHRRAYFRARYRRHHSDLLADLHRDVEVASSPGSRQPLPHRNRKDLLLLER